MFKYIFAFRCDAGVPRRALHAAGWQQFPASDGSGATGGREDTRHGSCTWRENHLYWYLN